MPYFCCIFDGIRVMVKKKIFWSDHKKIPFCCSVYSSYGQKRIFTSYHKKVCFCCLDQIGDTWNILFTASLLLKLNPEIILCNPRFLGDIRSARSSRIFELCLSVRLFVKITFPSEHKVQRNWNLANGLVLSISWQVSKMCFSA